MLLIQYSAVEWKKAMAMRDVISHHYFDLDAELVFAVCKEHIPLMNVMVKRMLDDLGDSTVSFDEEDA
jgi:uncharacterized protein with HEPN domain